MLKNILEGHNCFKLVCGAGNEDTDEIEKLVYVYSKAGCNIFDLSANIEVIKAAKRGLKKSNITQDRYLCVSVGIKGDPHINKAEIDTVKCKKCDACKKICPQNAITEDIRTNYIKPKKCIGCGKCLTVCPHNCIQIKSQTVDLNKILPEIIKENIDCIELHAITDNELDIYQKWGNINNLYSGIVSICVDRSKLSNEKMIERIKKMIKDRKPYTTIIQADGSPMSGGKDDYNTTLQAVATAEIVQKSELPVYILLSGGTNSKSSELAKLCDIKISGVAIGSYARKIIKKYIDSKNFWTNIDLQNSAITTAKTLVDAITKNL